MNIQILTLETWRLNIRVQAVISINLTEKPNNLKIKQSLKGNAGAGEMSQQLRV